MFKINGWRIHHDGYSWWATRDTADETRACISWLEAALYASANPQEDL